MNECSSVYLRMVSRVVSQFFLNIKMEDEIQTPGLLLVDCDNETGIRLADIYF